MAYTGKTRRLEMPKAPDREFTVRLAVSAEAAKFLSDCHIYGPIQVTHKVDASDTRLKSEICAEFTARTLAVGIYIDSVWISPTHIAAMRFWEL